MLGLISLVITAAAPNPNAYRVLVIENESSPVSVQIASNYLRARQVHNLLKVSCQDSSKSAAEETMPYAKFKTTIQDPLWNYLKRHPKIDFIVLTKGIPIRLTGATTGVNGTQPSLDSTIASIDYGMRSDAQKITVTDTNFTGKAWVNRFWNSKERFTHHKFGGYLVTRLDAFTTDEALRLVHIATEAEKRTPKGVFILDTAPSHGLGDVSKVPESLIKSDGKAAPIVGEMDYKDWDADLVVAGHLLKDRGLNVNLDLNDVFVTRTDNILGYASWGSNDPKFDDAGYKLLWFALGGIAETAVSTSGRTFLPATGGQSLIGDLIHAGVAGVKGYCDEPLLQAIASPTILFDRYTSGWTLAESFYAASRLVGWEDIVVGDPLCCPFKKR